MKKRKLLCEVSVFIVKKFCGSIPRTVDFGVSDYFIIETSNNFFSLFGLMSSFFSTFFNFCNRAIPAVCHKAAPLLLKQFIN